MDSEALGKEISLAGDLHASLLTLIYLTGIQEVSKSKSVLIKLFLTSLILQVPKN